MTKMTEQRKTDRRTTGGTYEGPERRGGARRRSALPKPTEGHGDTPSWTSRLGECYRLAFQFHEEHPTGYLVHGTINGKVFGVDLPPNPHAWCINQHGAVIWEPVFELQCAVETFSTVFLPIGFKMYDRIEAARLLDETGHYGSWDKRSDQARALIVAALAENT